MDPDSEIQFEFYPFIRQYKSGRVHRFFGTDIVPASVDPKTGVASKDVVINATSNLAVRLHLPNLSDKTTKKIPVFVYYHGGGFVIGSAFGPICHNHLNVLVAEANVIAVSVDYRLAPEHPLPIAYDDSWEALNWVFSHADKAGDEPWLAEHGDFSRVFLGGCSAGGNIAHQMAIRAGKANLAIKGLVLIHPYFDGVEPVGLEVDLDADLKAKQEAMWRFICPGTTGLDDPLANPFAEGKEGLRGLGCKKIMVGVAEKDILRDRGRWYCEGLKKNGWGGVVELLESEGEDHGFHVMKPSCEKALELNARTAMFLNSN
ncbi:probable carboxylesterase 12 [Typha angustifolia]|uniref:probable carboxylesterase 12 n=1 Tax=Typha angustifolia TaxID=59011 RepID=UPI003C2D2043